MSVLMISCGVEVGALACHPYGTQEQVLLQWAEAEPTWWVLKPEHLAR